MDTQELEDETTGLHPQPVEIRRLNFKLLLSTVDRAGYETLPIAQIKKADRAEATPELDESYIPPLLACNAWKPLARDILEGIYDRIGALLEKHAALVVSRRISLESQSPGDRLILEQLRALNEAFALLRIMVFAQGVHPFPAYLELCCLVGRLVIFSKKLARDAWRIYRCTITMTWATASTRSRSTCMRFSIFARPITRNGPSCACRNAWKFASNRSGLSLPGRCLSAWRHR